MEAFALSGEVLQSSRLCVDVLHKTIGYQWEEGTWVNSLSIE